MRSLGIDIGSRTIKAVLLDDGQIAQWEVADATSRPFNVAKEMLGHYPGIPVMATGYGRSLFEVHDIPTVTEIKACACGVKWLCPETETIIDIGGQDVKVIVLDSHGKVAKFEMNDRCAAGTGKFLEIMASKLDYSLEEFGAAALKGNDTVTINSLCAVFAESEVIGLLNRNVRCDDIARAVHTSVINKLAGMFKRIAPVSSVVVVAGGGALSKAILTILEKRLETSIRHIDHPRITAALGAALLVQQPILSATSSK